MPSVFDLSLSHDLTTLLGIKHTPSFLKSTPTSTSISVEVGTHMPIHSMARW